MPIHSFEHKKMPVVMVLVDILGDSCERLWELVIDLVSLWIWYTICVTALPCVLVYAKLLSCYPLCRVHLECRISRFTLSLISCAPVSAFLLLYVSCDSLWLPVPVPHVSHLCLLTCALLCVYSLCQGCDLHWSHDLIRLWLSCQRFDSAMHHPVSILLHITATFSSINQSSQIYVYELPFLNNFNCSTNGHLESVSSKLLYLCYTTSYWICFWVAS